MEITNQQIDFWKKKREEILIQNENNGFSIDDRRKKGYRSCLESNTCPICNKFSEPQHYEGIEEEETKVWFHGCESCQIGFKEVWSSDHRYLYHEI